MKYILTSLLAVILFTACSSKKYFEPEDVENDLEVQASSLPSSIKSMNRVGATLESNEVITRYGLSDFQLPENFEFLNLSIDGKVIASNKKDKILIGDEELILDNVVIAASLKDDKLALIYSDNSIELLNVKTKKTLFKDYLSESLANDTRVVNPYFMGNLILFPTLNGKVIIVSTISNDSVKNISVDPKGQFNNIIFLDVDKPSQTLITATANKVVSISTKEILSKDYEIRDIILKDEYVYIATIDGQLIKLALDLKEVSKKKFKYSKIHALSFTNALYAIESQGYAIKLNEDFTRSEVLEFDFDNEERMIVLDNKIYFDDKFITLP
ncbi:hypothetical protein [Arcobacter roscoffensis]|uniref:L-seryl-tRNA selenium transferase n=1 Tax=Arcobacter roscoffensis TaxID=2961520 RepID=A0ABY5E5J3_9BACT|nr:hypothetical protein [Arcobacter roscoffensis]UTJ06774.1 hypothetical protein NJU99_01435 [Arcobacter roscoffensis]